jgi:hypothetical protein
MPRVGFDPMNPAFERAKTVHALDGAATVIGEVAMACFKILSRHSSGETEKTHHSIRIIRNILNSNQIPPEYKYTALKIYHLARVFTQEV